MARTGRQNKKNILYDNLEIIKKWKANGASDEQVFKSLGISKATYYKHLSENADLSDAIKNATMHFVMDLRGELARQALPHKNEKKEQWVKTDKNGDKILFTKIVTQDVDGNIGAIHLLLKNIDRENWAEDWHRIELKKQELELREKIADDKNF